MTRDLQANRFIIPASRNYNSSELPFAYPPLAFSWPDCSILLSDWISWILMRWLPLIFNLLCIPAFYLFARQFLE